MSCSHSSGDDGSNSSSGGYSEDEPSQGPASSYSSSDKMLSQLGITPKIAPSYDGTTSWFEYEQLVDDWCGSPESQQYRRKH